MKDKLQKKVKKQKVNPIVVINETFNQFNFYTWLTSFRPLDKRIFSLKRLARIYLAENPNLYFEYEMNRSLEKEDMRIIQDKSCWEDD